MPERATRCADERAALDAFCARIAALDPDVLTGWNTIDFDLTVLERIAARLRHPFNLGREPGPVRIRKAEGYFGSGQASVPGRLVLDGIDLLRGAFVRMDDYSLDAVAREVLGEGKALKGREEGEARRDARDRIGEILHNYRNDLPAFALYARTDARLAYDIVARLEPHPARLRAHAPDRHDAGPRRGEHRFVRLPVPERASAPGHRRANACASTTRACSPRSRAGMCWSR